MQDFNRNLYEIHTHQYFFNRTEVELGALENLTKEDFQNIFELVFFDKAKRIDFQMTSKEHEEDQKSCSKMENRQELDMDSLK